MKWFNLFGGVAPADQGSATAQDVRALIADYQNVTIPGLEKELAEVEARLARPGRYGTADKHEKDEWRRDELRREIAAFKDRIPDLEKEAAEQETSERHAALEARRPGQRDFIRKHKAAERDFEAAVARLKESMEAVIALENDYQRVEAEIAAEGLPPMKSLTELFGEPQKVITPEQMIYKDVWYEPIRPGGPLALSGKFVGGKPVHPLAELKREFSHRIPEELSPGRPYVTYAERRRAAALMEYGW